MKVAAVRLGDVPSTGRSFSGANGKGQRRRAAIRASGVREGDIVVGIKGVDVLPNTAAGMLDELAECGGRGRKVTLLLRPAELPAVRDGRLLSPALGGQLPASLVHVRRGVVDLEAIDASHTDVYIEGNDVHFPKAKRDAVDVLIRKVFGEPAPGAAIPEAQLAALIGKGSGLDIARFHEEIVKLREVESQKLFQVVFNNPDVIEGYRGGRAAEE